MEKGLPVPNKKEGILLLLLSIFFFVGFLGHLLPWTQELMAMLTPWVIGTAGILCAVFAVKASGYPLVIWMIIASVVTYFLEVLGVKTGLVFGAYCYGPVLGVGALGVPYVIGFNWVLVILGASQLVEGVVKNPIAGAVGAAVIAVVFDFILEPVAIHLNYWTWSSGHIPLQNYAAWFVIGFAVALGYYLTPKNGRSAVPGYYFVIQTGFFLLLRFYLGVVS
ncbi:MAG: carotenoid biosynthesis protein [Spirochaetia bacterium]